MDRITTMMNLGAIFLRLLHRITMHISLVTLWGISILVVHLHLLLLLSFLVWHGWWEHGSCITLWDIIQIWRDCASQETWLFNYWSLVIQSCLLLLLSERIVVILLSLIAAVVTERHLVVWVLMLLLGNLLVLVIVVELRLQINLISLKINSRRIVIKSRIILHLLTLSKWTCIVQVCHLAFWHACFNIAGCCFAFRCELVWGIMQLIGLILSLS